MTHKKMPLITEVDVAVASAFIALASLVVDVDESSLGDRIGREVIKWTGRPLREGPSFLCARIPLTEKRARKSCWRACESCNVHAYAPEPGEQNEMAQNENRRRIGKKFKKILCWDACAMRRDVTRAWESATP